MKNVIFTFIILLFIGKAHAQTYERDVVYLKSGKAYKGKIIERVPNEYIKILTIKESEITIVYEDIEKVIQKPRYYFMQDLVYLKNGKKIIGEIISNNGDKDLLLLTKSLDSISIKQEDIKVMKKRLPAIEKPNGDTIMDFVFLKNGDRIRGEIVKQDADVRVGIKVHSGDTLFLNEDEIDAIRTLPSDDLFFLRKENQYTSIGPGIGISYGGIGWRFQQRFGNIQGFAYHFGLGVFPADKNFYFSTWVNAGLKFYMYKWFYLDMSYGTIKRVSNIDIYGASLMLGGDYFYHKNAGFNIAVGISSDLLNSGIDKTFFNVEIGWIIKFRNKQK